MLTLEYVLLYYEYVLVCIRWCMRLNNCYAIDYMLDLIQIKKNQPTKFSKIFACEHIGYFPIIGLVISYMRMRSTSIQIHTNTTFCMIKLKTR